MSDSRDCRDTFSSSDVFSSCMAEMITGITADIGSESSSEVSTSFSTWLAGNNTAATLGDLLGASLISISLINAGFTKELSDASKVVNVGAEPVDRIRCEKED